MPKFHKFQASPGASMKAIIIYDNFVFAETAKLMLKLAAYQGDAAVYWNIRPWRVDALSLLHNADEALADAADAHLILFAGQRTQSLPSWLVDWLERWVACHQIKDAAFAVIGGKNGDALSMPSAPELAHFADKHGLSFIIDDRLAINRGGGFAARGEPEDEIPRLMDLPDDGSNRGWGLND